MILAGDSSSVRAASTPGINLGGRPASPTDVAGLSPCLCQSATPFSSLSPRRRVPLWPASCVPVVDGDDALVRRWHHTRAHSSKQISPDGRLERDLARRLGIFPFIGFLIVLGTR